MTLESRADATHRNPVLGLGLALALWVVAYSVLSTATAAMSEDAMGRLAGTPLLLLPLFAALALTLTTMWLILRGVLLEWTVPGLVVAGVICTAVSQGVHLLFDPSPERSLATVLQFGVANVALIGSSLFIGKLIAGRVENLSWVIPIVLVLTAVDIWSVYFGPTGRVAAEIQETPLESELGQALLLWYPNLTPAGEGGLAVTPAFGFGDLIVAAILLEVARRFALPLMRNLVALVVAIVTSLLSALLTPSGIPALPFIAALFVGVNWRAIPKNPREIALCAAFLVALLTVLVFIVNPLASAFWPGEEL